MNNSKLDRISPSMVGSYLNCPLAFYYAFVAKIEIPQKQIHLLFGSAIHKAIEDGVYGTKDPYASFKVVFDKNRLLDEEKNLHAEYLTLGAEMIKNYIDNHGVLDKLYDLNNGESETYIRRKLINPLTNEESTLPMSGRLDRLTYAQTADARYSRIIEYKTSKNKWRQDDIGYKIQTLMYNLWFYSEFGVLPDETVYIILLKKHKRFEGDQTYQVLSTHYTLTDLASMFEEVELIVQKINNGIFDRPTGWHPRYCDCYKYEEILNLR